MDPIDTLDTEINKDELRDLQEIGILTQETRFKIIILCLAHPKESPSQLEIKHMTGLGTATTYRQLNKLSECGFIEKTLNKENVETRNLPQIFYRPTQKCRDMVEKYDLFDIDSIRESYAELDLPESVKRCENAPR